MISSELSSLESSPSTPPSSENGGQGGDEYEDVEMDFTAELTRRMAQFMLQDEDDDEDDAFPRHGLGLSSEHSQIFSDFGGGFVSSKGSWSSGDSPPFTPSTVADADSDHGREPYDIVKRFQKMDLPKTDSFPIKKKAPFLQALPPYSHHQNQAHSSYPVTPEDVSPRRKQLNLPASSRRGGWSRQWNHQRSHRVSGAGMQAIFLGGHASRSQSTGTGVFLPRGACNSTESRKQPRCSTALIPARVVQALITHFDRVGSQPKWRSADGRLAPQIQEKSQSEEATYSSNSKDINIPQEWIY
ncbi:hypothetical protein SAY86_031326 [Trapa natans]|uniref:Uncharacterized protein n=1 Tax=Trapa natans TaxID=22666 RepID=A0AAN7M377_TRANT|nr:hypothetical protein SAY86_031326 [Trapa natans]